MTNLHLEERRKQPLRKGRRPIWLQCQEMYENGRYSFYLYPSTGCLEGICGREQPYYMKAKEGRNYTAKELQRSLEAEGSL